MRLKYVHNVLLSIFIKIIPKTQVRDSNTNVCDMVVSVSHQYANICNDKITFVVCSITLISYVQRPSSWFVQCWPKTLGILRNPTFGACSAPVFWGSGFLFWRNIVKLPAFIGTLCQERDISWRAGLVDKTIIIWGIPLRELIFWLMMGKDIWHWSMSWRNFSPFH